jgi:hypothetical protein
LIPDVEDRTPDMNKFEKNEARRTLHADAVNLMRRVLDLHAAQYMGCGFHWALERAAGGLLNQVADYDRPFTDETLGNLQGAYENLLEQVQAAEASRDEQALCARLAAATTAAEALDREVEAHFRPLVEACLAKGDAEGARKLVARMPDAVGKVFLLDTIRQHGKV